MFAFTSSPAMIVWEWDTHAHAYTLTHPPLEAVPLSQRPSVGFGDDGDDIHFAVDRFHELHIQGLQSTRTDSQI